MEKTTKVSGSGGGFRLVLSKKKRRDGVLKNGFDDFNSINIEEKCLVEETSFNYGEGNVLAGKNPNQMPKNSGVKTKTVLGKPLGKINFSIGSNDNDVLSDVSLELSPFLKNLVDVSVYKSFILNVGLDKIAGKTSQKKYLVIRKLFSGINGFGRASISSKFSGIIRTMFTSKFGLIKAIEKAAGTKIVVNADFKKFIGCSDQAVVLKKILVRTFAKTVCAAQKTIIEFEEQNQANFLADKWSIFIEKNAVHKICAINHYPVTYAQARCVIVCFKSAELLNAIMKTTLVLKVFSDADKSRLAAIYFKCLALVAHCVFFRGLSWTQIAGRSFFSPFLVCNILVKFGFFLEMKSTSLITKSIDNKFTILEHGLASFVKQINELVKRLESLVPAVFQSSPESQLLVTLSLQNQVGNIVIEKGLSKATSGKTTVILDFLLSFKIVKLENMFKDLSTSVFSLDLVWKFAMCNVRSINISAKQKNIVHWHMESENMVSIITEMKLKFDDVRIFSSGLNKEFLGAEIAIVMNNFLACHVSKVEEISDKLSVTVLGLYVGVFSETRFETINYIFVSDSLSSAVAGQNVVSVSNYFNTNHKAVVMLVGLSRLLNVCLNNLHKQANKNYWKFKIADANNPKWACFKESFSVMFSSMVDKFLVASANGDFDFMWSLLKALEVWTILNNGANSVDVFSCLSRFRKSYCCSKMHKSKAVEAAIIKHTIDKRMENFCLNKDHIIRSILDKSFYKVVFDYLMVDNELVLDPGEVKFKVNMIIESVFSGVIDIIGFDEFFQVIKHLPDGKAAGLSGISNEMWKHCDKIILKNLLDFLNLCLRLGMIPLYNWDGILTNTCPIALVETACKILFKILSDQIFLTCSKFRSSIFAVGLVVEDALKKNREVWLVLRNMCKTYNSVSWHHLEAIFGLLDSYQMLDGLDQSKVFFFLLWQIFYDLLLCKFVAKIDRINNISGMTFFFVASAFVDNTIWVGSSQTVTQFILDITSNFFVINNISINNNKTVAILINQKVQNAVLRISESFISIVRCSVPYRYLGIFLSTSGLSKPSLAKA
ncbi:hypothetical protein G9A89_015526 [Geosiphon pyriformis]|nr:hypothetical protein G9A89_015526 [Geosiphon pyriformis]